MATANGSSNNASVLLNTIPPIITAVSDTNSLCAGNTVTLTASGANTYTWSTTQTGTSIAITPTVTTTYTVTGTTIAGCTNLTTVTQTVTNCVGIATFNNVKK